MNKVNDLVACPNCGGNLIYEEFFQVGHVYKVNKATGRVSKRWKRTSENSEEAQMLYCEKCHQVIENYSISTDTDITITIQQSE